jgi:hypothetical protein
MATFAVHHHGHYWVRRNRHVARQTYSGPCGMSAKCQKRTHALQQFYRYSSTSRRWEGSMREWSIRLLIKDIGATS